MLSKKRNNNNNVQELMIGLTIGLFIAIIGRIISDYLVEVYFSDYIQSAKKKMLYQ